jgi:protein phosphatase
VVLSIVTDDVMTIGGAGDSRAYLLRDGQLSQLTRDDSWVSAAWAEGILSSDEIDKHPLRNVITKAVGAKETLDTDIVEHKFQDGDVAMLCSDGLHGMISDQEILEVLGRDPGPLEDAAKRLIAAANEAGGKDNVTAVLLRYRS